MEREALVLPEEGGQYAGQQADHVCPHKLGLEEREALVLPEEGGQYAGHQADHVCPHKLGLVERETNQQEVEGSALHEGRRVLNNGASSPSE